jgi:hypothetical protein
VQIDFDQTGAGAFKAQGCHLTGRPLADKALHHYMLNSSRTAACTFGLVTGEPFVA